MAKRWNRMETWLTLGVLGVGGVLLAIAGLWVYMSATSTPIHPSAQDVPVAAHDAPAPAWTDAAARGRQIAREMLAEQNLPGLSVAVGVNSELVWAEGFGWADIEQRVPVTPVTGFRIGTASKVLTSAAVGLLLEEGRLELDVPIQRYVPEFPEKEWPVTLRQLMAHVAGVRRDAGDEEPITLHCADTVDGLRRFADRPLLFEPGTHYRYSNYGWVLVSAAVEAAGGERFETFMRQRVFAPLGMIHTRLDPGFAPVPERSTYYFPRFVADPRYGPQDPEDTDFTCFAGASAFLSTPSDLVRFGMAIGTHTLLQPATVHLLQASQQLASGEDTGYGLGWDLETVTLGGQQTLMIGYDGLLRDGQVSSLMMFSDRGLVVAVTSNTSFANTTAVAAAIADAFAARLPDPPRP